MADEADTSADAKRSEDERAAAPVVVGISNYVGSASLAVMAGAVGLFTYISQTFEPPWAFDLLMLLAATAVVGALVLGGHGSDRVATRLKNGSWPSAENIWEFNAQALLTLLALLLVVAGTVVGATSDTKASGTETRVERLELRVVKLEASLETLQGERRTTLKALADLRKQIRELRDP